MLRSIRRGVFAGTLLLVAAAAFAAPEGNPKVEMVVANRGKIVLELYQKEAPKTVEQFLRLTKEKYWDGILFHRVIKDFMAQAGDPKSKTMTTAQALKLDDGRGSTQGLGEGGSGKNIPFEENKFTHEPGTIAMALSAPHSDTADSQFFINFVPNHRLDGQYCVFGKIVQGMDVLMKVERGDKIVSIREVTAKAKPKPKK